MKNKNAEVPEGYKRTELGVIPDEWEVKSLGECAKLQGGFAFKSKDAAECGVRWLKIANVGIGSIKWEVESYLSLDFIENYSDYILKKDQIVMAMTRPVLGDKLKITKLKETDVPSLLNQRVGRFIITENFDSEYLYQVAKDIQFLEEVKIKIRGTDPPNISSTHIESIKIAVPPFQEQQKIASILSKVDEQIEQTEKIIEKTELLKKGLMQKLLTKGLGHTKFRKTELGEIPEDWDIKKVNDFCDVKTGGTPSTKNRSYWDGDIPWMSSGEINKKFIYDTEKKITQQGLENSNTRILPKNTVMIALNGQGKTRGTVAVLKIPSTCNQSLACLIPNKNNSHYLYIYYNLQKRYSEIRNYTGDAGREGLNLKIIKDISIPLPSLDEQQKIASILSKVDSQIQDNQNYLTRLQEIKKGLMQDLLTGKVRVCV